MKNKRLTVLILLLTTSILVWSQNKLQAGFDLLENQHYAEAEKFFSTILQDNASDFTAQICYGRAIGLNQQPLKALNWFEEMNQKNPNNLEVQLNLAEAYIWNKKFTDAIQVYSELLEKHAQDSSILLGSANALSANQQYQEAFEQITTALQLSPDNSSVKNSFYYIGKAYAYQLSQLQQYKESLQILQTLSLHYPNDWELQLQFADTYMQAGNYKEALTVYEALNIPNQNPFQYYAIGTSLLFHLQNKDKQALERAQEALRYSENHQFRLVESIERYIQALIWNQNYSFAKAELERYKPQLPLKNYFALQAMWETYKGKYDQSIQTYSQLLETDSLSFDGLLGRTNAYYGNQQYAEAEKSLNLTEQVFPLQKDVLFFKLKLKQLRNPSAKNQSFYTEDIGKNVSYNNQFQLDWPLSYTFTLVSGFDYRKTVDYNALQTQNYKFSLGYQWLIFNQLQWKSTLNYYTDPTHPIEKNWLGASNVKWNLNARSTWEAGVQQYVQNFNTQLAENQITTTDWYSIINIYTLYNLGVYGQVYYSSYSDGNTRNLLYTSVYYKWLKKPEIKTALNFQYIGFQMQLPSVYFSPSSFNLYEGMVSIENLLIENKKNQWIYQFIVGFGRQNIENNKSQSTSRFRFEMGYKFNYKQTLKLYYGKSNVASSSAAGYQLQETGLIGIFKF